MTIIAIRGTDTRLGEAGWCPACKQSVPAGPDACLGMIDGVREACCGHGETSRTYVTFWDGRHFTGKEARLALGLPTWPARP